MKSSDKPKRQYIRRVRHVPLGTDNFLSVLEGLEGGFAILTGVLVGLSFSTLDREILLIAAIVTMIVNAFNSSAIRYSTQHYMDEVDGHEKRKIWQFYLLPSFTEFFVYLFVSTLVILPLGLLDSVVAGISWAIFLTIGVLFLAGFYKGRLLRTHPLRDAVELTFLGTLIIAVGAVAGYTLSNFTL